MGLIFTNKHRHHDDSAQKHKQKHNKRSAGLGGLGTIVLLGTVGLVLYDPIRRSVGQFLHRQLEHVLSLLTGANVRFQRLHASIMNGTIEAEGMSITRKGMAEPLLTVDYVRAQTSISRALKGELILHTLDMEHPVLRIVRHGDTHTNIPSRLQIDPTEAPQKANELLDLAERAGEKLDRLGLKLNIEHALVTDGEVHLIDETADRFHIAAQGIIEEFGRCEGGYDYCAIIGSLGRRDQLGELGEVRISGRIENIDDLTQIGHARIICDVTIGDQLRISVDCPELHSRRVVMTVDGAADMATLHPLIPPNISALEPLRALSQQGRMAISTTIAFDPNQGLNVSDVTGGGVPSSGGMA